MAENVLMLWNVGETDVCRSSPYRISAHESLELIYRKHEGGLFRAH